MVFLSVGIVQRNLADAEIKILTLLSFMLGVFLFTIYKEKLRIVKKPILSLVPLAILSLIIGFIPLSVDNMFIIPPLAFCMGLVTTAFGEVSGIAYNNAFMTGNINAPCWLLANMLDQAYSLFDGGIDFCEPTC